MTNCCNICKKLVDESSRSIFCDICDSWIHFQSCSRLSLVEFDALSQDVGNWACPKCLDKALPFSEFNHQRKLKTSKSIPSPNDNVRSLISDLNNVVRNQDNDTNSVDFSTTSCKFYECEDFNNLNVNPKSLSAFHLNIASMAKHFDELNTLLALLKHKFSYH